MFPQLARFTDFGLLLLRLMVGLIFVTSGYSDLKDPEGRAKSIGVSKGFTIFLGIAELAGGLGGSVWGSDSTRRDRSDPHHVRRHPEKDLFLAHRFLGREGLGMALRSHACSYEHRDSIYQRRFVRADVKELTDLHRGHAVFYASSLIVR